jgi:hypothetical protein
MIKKERGGRGKKEKEREKGCNIVCMVYDMIHQSNESYLLFTWFTGEGLVRALILEFTFDNSNKFQTSI